VPDTCRLTELETVGNDSCSIPEEEEEDLSRPLGSRSNRPQSNRPKLDGSCGNCAGWWEVPVSDCSLEEGIPVRFVVSSFLEKAMLASCPAVVMPNI
jgi:hypothetical protein